MGWQSQAFWVNVAAGCVVAACLIGVVVICTREKRRTGSYPRTVTGGRNTAGWFALAYFLWFTASIQIGEAWLRRFPLNVLISGLDASLLLAGAAFAAFALSYAFGSE